MRVKVGGYLFSSGSIVKLHQFYRDSASVVCRMATDITDLIQLEISRIRSKPARGVLSGPPRCDLREYSATTTIPVLFFFFNTQGKITYSSLFMQGLKKKKSHSR